jgi:hypothetical protein
VGLIMSHRAGRRTASRKVTSLLILITCVLVPGCHLARTTWSAEARSPDGLWLAIARSEQGGGLGASYDVTTVNLKQTKGRQTPVQILLFSHNYPTMNLKMDWLSSNRLSVTYGESARPGDQVNLEFQVIKCAGIDISVRKVSGETVPK